MNHFTSGPSDSERTKPHAGVFDVHQHLTALLISNNSLLPTCMSLWNGGTQALVSNSVLQVPLMPAAVSHCLGLPEGHWLFHVHGSPLALEGACSGLSQWSPEAGRVMGKCCSHVCLCLPLFAGCLPLATESNVTFLSSKRSHGDSTCQELQKELQSPALPCASA